MPLILLLGPFLESFQSQTNGLPARASLSWMFGLVLTPARWKSGQPNYELADDK